MKKFLLSIVLVICACTFVLAGCGPKGLDDNPSTSATITGNGGYAIQKGDYLYYINGYVDEYETTLTDYKKDNVYGSVKYGAIYRTKLVNGEISRNEKGFLNKTERVVSKVVGYENGGFYIVGDYIYYATPNMSEDPNGNLENTRIAINRIRINGVDNKEVCVTSASASEAKWQVNVINNKAYIVVTEKFGDTYTVTSFADNGKKFGRRVVVSGATEVALNTNVDLTSEYIYYTRSVKDNDSFELTTTGTLVCTASLVSGNETPYELDKSSTFNLKALANGRLYLMNGTIMYAYMADQNLVNQTPVQLNLNEFSNFYTIADVPYAVVALDADKNLVYFENVGGVAEKNRKTLATNVSNVVEVGEEGYVYYVDTENNMLYSVSLNGDVKTLSGNPENAEKSYLISDVNMVDVDSRYVYVFATYTAANGTTTSYYLNQIDTQASEAYGQFVGCMTDEHMVADPNADNEEGDEEEIVWIY